MAFWGVEVKPGKPFHHPPSDASGKRLHVSQATLGIGTATTRSVVQCNVGESTPVLLCSLRPDTVESSRLNLEFEESDEVVFSVLGPLSVHLTGYYVQSLGNEMEPHGEDIANTDNELSVDSGNEDDEYEDSFIDDGDPAINPSSPDSGDEAADVKCGRKKYHLIESSFEEQGIVKALKPLDNNSEDNLPISLLLPKHKHEEKGTRIESETNTGKTYKHEEEEEVNKSETGKMKQREVGEVEEIVNKDETTKLEQPIDLVSTFDVKSGRRRLKKKYELIDSSSEEQGIAKALKTMDNNSEDNLPTSLLLSKHKHEEKETGIANEVNTRKSYKHEEEEKVNKSETSKTKQREVDEVEETVNKNETIKLEQMKVGEEIVPAVDDVELKSCLPNSKDMASKDEAKPKEEKMMPEVVKALGVQGCSFYEIVMGLSAPSTKQEKTNEQAVNVGKSKKKKKHSGKEEVVEAECPTVENENAENLLLKTENDKVENVRKFRKRKKHTGLEAEGPIIESAENDKEHKQDEVKAVNLEQPMLNEENENQADDKNCSVSKSEKKKRKKRRNRSHREKAEAVLE